MISVEKSRRRCHALASEAADIAWQVKDATLSALHRSWSTSAQMMGAYKDLAAAFPRASKERKFGERMSDEAYLKLTGEYFDAMRRADAACNVYTPVPERKEYELKPPSSWFAKKEEIEALDKVAGAIAFVINGTGIGTSPE